MEPYATPSAVAVTFALATLSHSNALPDLVVSLGSAGSRTLEHTGVYQVASVCYRDMDASALGFEKGRDAICRPSCGVRDP
jgi:adenosylhomocysteine nucleosidase